MEFCSCFLNYEYWYHVEINVARQAKWCRQLWWVVGKLHFLVLVCNTSKLWPIIPKQKEVAQGGGKGHGLPRQVTPSDRMLRRTWEPAPTPGNADGPFRSSTGGLLTLPRSVVPCKHVFIPVHVCLWPLFFPLYALFLPNSKPWCMFIKKFGARSWGKEGIWGILW